MVERQQDLWSFGRSVDAVVVTTNGIVRNDGTAVMGGGCALEAAERYWDLPKVLGAAITAGGNHVYDFFCCTGQFKGTYERVVAFPTKLHYKYPSTLPLIERSTKELVTLTQERSWKKVVLPRPGCGLGGLLWEDVRPVLEPLLDDRFIVVSP